MMDRFETGRAAFVMPHWIADDDMALCHFDAAVASVMSQTDPDWVLVIVDDHSEGEAPLAHLRRVGAALGPRGKVLYAPRRVGPSLARNLGIRAAAELGAPFILLLDADDLADPRRLEATRAAFCSGGEGAMSAWAAFNSFGYIFFAITSSIGAATRMLCSVYIGENDRTSLAQTMRTALGLGVGMVCALAALIVMTAVPFTRLFYRDPSTPVYQLTLWLFRLFPFSMPLSAIFVAMQTYLQTFGRIRAVNVLSAFDGLLGTVIVGVVLTPLYGAMGLWVTQIVNGVIVLGLLVGYAALREWRFPRSFILLSG